MKYYHINNLLNANIAISKNVLLECSKCKEFYKTRIANEKIKKNIGICLKCSQKMRKQVKDEIVDSYIKDDCFFSKKTHEKLLLTQKVKYECISCGKDVISKLQKENKKKIKFKCSSCAHKKNRNLSKPIKIENVNKDFLLIKQRHEQICNNCNGIYITTLANEKRKKYTGLCQGCAVSEMWKDKDYRKNHIKNMREAWKCPLVRKRARKRNSLSYKYKETNFRSSYEMRLAKLLDKHKYTWKYEPNSFELVSYENKIYVPDFFVDKINLWIEVKGYFYRDSKEKWEAFCLENKNKKTLLVDKNVLESLEGGKISFENFI